MYVKYTRCVCADESEEWRPAGAAEQFVTGMVCWMVVPVPIDGPPADSILIRPGTHPRLPGSASFNGSGFGAFHELAYLRPAVSYSPRLPDKVIARVFRQVRPCSAHHIRLFSEDW